MTKAYNNVYAVQLEAKLCCLLQLVTAGYRAYLTSVVASLWVSSVARVTSLSLSPWGGVWVVPPYQATSAPTIGQLRPIPTRFLIFNWKTREPRTGKGEDRRLKRIGFVKQSWGRDGRELTEVSRIFVLRNENRDENKHLLLRFTLVIWTKYWAQPLGLLLGPTLIKWSLEI